LSTGVAHLLQRIERLSSRGASLDEIEDRVIDPTAISERKKSALWLYAWSLMPRRSQLREATRLVRHVD
jgi:hypothetical protein